MDQNLVQKRTHAINEQSLWKNKHKSAWKNNAISAWKTNIIAAWKIASLRYPCGIYVSRGRIMSNP
eukprot:12358887-Heterocapsa_arctica.AAC.1